MRLRRSGSRARSRRSSLCARVASAQTSDAATPAATPTPAPVANVSEGTSRSTTRPDITLSGYVEAFYQWNFNNPSNGHHELSRLRQRGTTPSPCRTSCSTPAGRSDPCRARLALQVGSTPETYYLAEPDRRRRAARARANSNVWKFIQQAIVGWRAPVGAGLLVEAGIFLSPIGPEGMAVKDQWNWSRSNLFFGLPFYHTGARLSYPLGDRTTLSLAGYNGWNSVVDNNDEKSVSVALDYVVTDRITVHALYFGGVERAAGAPERAGSTPWRNVFDAYVALYPTPWLSLLAHANGGFEPNAFGVSWWGAGALYARVRLRPWLFVAARGDAFYESVPSNGAGAASPIFWPSAWVSSQTLTLDARPHDNVSMRLEYRHDQADGDTYFRGAVSNDATTHAPIANARAQDTLTLGMTAWF